MIVTLCSAYVGDDIASVIWNDPIMVDMVDVVLANDKIVGTRGPGFVVEVDVAYA